MSSKIKSKFFALAVLGMALGLFSCSGKQVSDTWEKDPDAAAAVLFEDANNAMHREDYVTSVVLYTRLKDEYPFSPYAIEAELSLADSYYLDQEWLQAVDAYKDFGVQHPRHTAMPYVLFQIGMANLRTYTSVDRPPTAVAEALSYFTRLRDSFTGHEYARKSAEQISICRRLLAEYELYSGDFFFRTENYYAAWLRYMIVLRDYREIEDLVRYAENRSQAAYFLYLKKNSEAKRRVIEGSWHKIIDWF
ncbi:MAG: outer membrane protein assembly factor BamD [Desulfovibrionaceae bacterium]|nr:outer membrane protein assembly factor BamD [Desulfovibrionaceae bacterium]